MFLYTWSSFCGRINQNSSKDLWVRIFLSVLDRTIFRLLLSLCSKCFQYLLDGFTSTLQKMMMVVRPKTASKVFIFISFYISKILVCMSSTSQYFLQYSKFLNFFNKNHKKIFFSVNVTMGLQKLLMVVGKTKPAQV